MKILLKILVAPFALALSLLAALLVFLFDICAVLLTIASVILAVLGVALFFTPTPIGGIVFLFLAFLLSPYGLQAVDAIVNIIRISVEMKRINDAFVAVKLFFYDKNCDNDQIAGDCSV